MTYLAAVLDLCVWAGEGFGGLDRWLELPESVQSLWFEHWSNVRCKAYDPPPEVKKTAAEIDRESEEANQKWFEACQKKRRNAVK